MMQLPSFKDIDIDSAIETLKTLIDENLALIDKTIAGSKPSMLALDTLEEKEKELNNFWAILGHLNSVANSDALRDVYTQGIQLLTDYHLKITYNEALFTYYSALKNSDEYQQAKKEQQVSVDKAIQSFKLQGIDLPAEKKSRLEEIQKQLSELSNQFSNNVLDATNHWEKHITDKSALKGIPEDSLALLKQNAADKDLDGYLINLQFPSYFPVITYADDGALREELYQAYSTRASENGADPKWDNTDNIKETLQLRAEKARILGFSNYSELSIQLKMAEETAEVSNFLNDLADKTRPFYAKEIAELKAFIKQQFSVDDLQAWDMAYYSEKYKKHLLDFSDNDVKPYFQVDNVLTGLFSLVEKLYGVQFKEQQLNNTWHQDVKFFSVLDRDDNEIAGFYLDLYARKDKRGGAWMDVCRSKLKTGNIDQKPIAYLTCNAAPPVEGQSTCFTHDEVITLFHEFGHGLHHMLTRIETSALSGISGVEWDAVELPSQFMENWCWEKSVLDTFAFHSETNELIPEDLFAKMLASKNFMSASSMIRQLIFSIFDWELHLQANESGNVDVQGVLNKVSSHLSLIDTPDYNRFQNSFSHIFAGGYAAGYYSYKWAEVLSADAFEAFVENGLFDQKTSQSFWDNVLAVGGSIPAKEFFVSFRGREPRVEAMLKHNGLKAA